MDDQPPMRDDRPRSTGGVSALVDDLLRRDLDEVYLLIDYLSGRSDRSIRTVQLEVSDNGETATESTTKKENLIDAVCRIRWPPENDQAHASKQAATLFKARDQLNELAAPASGLTIAYTLLYIPGRQGKSELARRAYPNLVQPAKQFRKWIRWLVRGMLIGLIFTSLLSWHVAYGRLVVLRIEQLDAQRAEIATELDAIKGIGPAVGHSTPTHGAPSEAWLENEQALVSRCKELKKVQPDDPRLQRACAGTTALQTKRTVADQALEEWSSYWLWLPRSAWWMEGAVSTGTDDPITAAERKEQWSANLLAILGNYVLPMMYGFLGAAAAVMLNVNQKIRLSRLSPRDRRMTPVQLVLGVITGACIGLFLTPSGAGAPGAPLSGGSVALSASALSFLAGFGVEGVFKMLENLLVTIFGGQTQPPAPQHRP